MYKNHTNVNCKNAFKIKTVPFKQITWTVVERRRLGWRSGSLEVGGRINALPEREEEKRRIREGGAAEAKFANPNQSQTLKKIVTTFRSGPSPNKSLSPTALLPMNPPFLLPNSYSSSFFIWAIKSQGPSSLLIKLIFFFYFHF